MSIHSRTPKGELKLRIVDLAIAGLERSGRIPPVRELCRMAGCSAGAPYRHFSGIEALEEAIDRRLMASGRRLVTTHIATMDKENA